MPELAGVQNTSYSGNKTNRINTEISEFSTKKKKHCNFFGSISYFVDLEALTDSLGSLSSY